MSTPPTACGYLGPGSKSTIWMLVLKPNNQPPHAFILWMWERETLNQKRFRNVVLKALAHIRTDFATFPKHQSKMVASTCLWVPQESNIFPVLAPHVKKRTRANIQKCFQQPAKISTLCITDQCFEHETTSMPCCVKWWSLSTRNSPSISLVF